MVWEGSFLGELVPILRHIGWEKCCHGITCRPRESSGEGFLSDLLSLMGYPNGSGIALLDGTLKLRYYTFPFAGRRPTWKLPTPGHVADVLTTGGENDGLFGVEPPGGSRGRAGFVRQSFKRVRLTEKTRCPIVYGEGRGGGRSHGALQPIPDVEFGSRRRVARRVHGVSSPGGRLDQEGIG